MLARLGAAFVVGLRTQRTKLGSERLCRPMPPSTAPAASPSKRRRGAPEARRRALRASRAIARGLERALKGHFGVRADLTIRRVDALEARSKAVVVEARRAGGCACCNRRSFFEKLFPPPRARAAISNISTPQECSRSSSRRPPWAPRPGRRRPSREAPRRSAFRVP
ncbi:hypothetical protein M885DRAFT_532219 [Pelagophyceae sp. CCMP2097]|nr:hypothetical protein M885DRAFT_532219 [Pelagophyceae sp. CCMP2097]